MKSAIQLFFALVYVFALYSCSVVENSVQEVKKIQIAPGPEDMVIDRKAANPRLLISCSARRAKYGSFGEIVSYTPETGALDTLMRVGMPDSLYFQPHGIFLDSLSTPQKLYAISHEHDEGFHPVYIWEIEGDTLCFSDLIVSDLLHSPNALTLGENGEVFIVNDAGKRGNMMEKAFKLNRANIVRMVNKNGAWEGKIVAEKLGYPAGINRIGNTIYAGDAINHLLHVYSINGDELNPLDPVKGLKGNDNIRVHNGKLYLTGHVKPLKFIAHTKSGDNLSPVKAWEFDPETEKITELFSTDGSLISAGSTAVLLNGKLYISQVFDPFIIEVEP